MATFATKNVLGIVMTNVIREQAYVEAVQKIYTVLTVIKHVQEIVPKVSVKEITVIVRNAWQVTEAKNVKSVVRTIVYIVIKTISNAKAVLINGMVLIVS